MIIGIRAFYGAEAEMRDAVQTSTADYLVVCPAWIEPLPGWPMPFVKHLVDGVTVDWLEPVALDAGPLKVWRVIR